MPSSSTVASRASTWASRHLWSQSRRQVFCTDFCYYVGFIDWIKYGTQVNMNCKWCLRSISYFAALGRTARDLTLQFANLSSAPLRTTLLISRLTNCTAVLHAGLLVTVHNLLSFMLCLHEGSRPGIYYFRPNFVVFLVAIPHAEATEDEKSRAALHIH